MSAVGQSKFRVATRLALLCLGTVVLLAALLVGGFRAYWWRYEHARAIWKTAALERLAGLSATNENIRQELEELKASPGTGDYRRWTGSQVVLMANGEYIIYAFWHGSNSGFVDHLFLGHGSDGRWLYSTYHFCNHMAGAEADPPASISEFAKIYSAREFDGKSDVCLQHTWPERK